MLPKRVEKLGFWEKDERRLGGGRGAGPDECESAGLSLREDIEFKDTTLQWRLDE